MSGSGSTNREPERCPLVLEGRQCTMQARHYGEYHEFGAVPADEPTPATSIHAAVLRAERMESERDVLAGRLAAVTELADKMGNPHIGAQVRFAAKHGQLQSDLKCRDCSMGDHYHCAHGQPMRSVCCCPERLDLNS